MVFTGGELACCWGKRRTGMKVDNLAADTKILSAYIHFPFCVKKCPYCDFVSYVGCMDKKETYIDSLCREIELTGKEQGTAELLCASQDCRTSEASCKYPGLATVYMGGGTPSLFTPEELGAVMQTLRRD